MKLELFLRIFSIGVLVFSNAYADDNRWLSVDVKNFDIAGVKLGMDYEQARAAAANHFKVPVKEIKPGAGFGFEVAKNDITQTMLPDHFNYRSKRTGESLAVTFSTRIPVDKAHPLIVDSVKYMTYGSQENNAALKEAARHKFGTPSFTAGGMDNWCASPKRNVMSCPTDEAYLYSSSGILTLIDPSYEATQRKYLEKARAIKPNI